MTFGPLEKVACALCGKRDLRPVVSEEWFGDTFQVVRCAHCKLMFSNPRPTPEWKRRFYDPRFNAHLADDGREFCYQPKGQGIPPDAPLWDFLRSNVPAGGRLLDVGCASGLFADACRAHGYAANGLDYSQKGPAHARREYGLDVLTADVENIPLADDSYDVITLIQVFEHFKNPIGALRELHRVLKPGGLLYIETVNYLKLYWLERYLSFLKPLYFKIRKADSPWWKDRLPWVPFDHYYHWTPRPLLAALQSAGFVEARNHYFVGADTWAATAGRRSALQDAYRSAVDALFRVSGKQLAGLLIATGRKASPNSYRRERPGG